MCLATDNTQLEKNPIANASVSKLLVSTDLDATLLDHHTYSYEAALPAIAQLKANGCPIIFNSSKTQAEQSTLREEIKLSAPFIVENGAAVIIPPGQLNHPSSAESPEVHVFGTAYSELIDKLHRLREQQGYRFRGFFDLSAAEVAEMTGLPVAGAAAAKQRCGTEPLRWEDTASAYESFVAQLAEQGLTTTQGGRFCHVMSQTNKGQALAWLVARYRETFPQIDWTVVALGDSPNDVSMMQVADIGVLIANPNRAPFEVTGVSTLVTPPAPGPTGWGEAISALIPKYVAAPSA